MNEWLYHAVKFAAQTSPNIDGDKTQQGDRSEECNDVSGETQEAVNCQEKSSADDTEHDVPVIKDVGLAQRETISTILNTSMRNDTVDLDATLEYDIQAPVTDAYTNDSSSNVASQNIDLGLATNPISLLNTNKEQEKACACESFSMRQHESETSASTVSGRLCVDVYDCCGNDAISSRTATEHVADDKSYETNKTTSTDLKVLSNSEKNHYVSLPTNCSTSKSPMEESESTTPRNCKEMATQQHEMVDEVNSLNHKEALTVNNVTKKCPESAEAKVDPTSLSTIENDNWQMFTHQSETIESKHVPEGEIIGDVMADCELLDDLNGRQIVPLHSSEEFSNHENVSQASDTHCNIPVNERSLCCKDDDQGTFPHDMVDQSDDKTHTINGIGVDDGLHGFDIDRIYVDACTIVSTNSTWHETVGYIDNEHRDLDRNASEASDSQTCSFHSCRENASFVDHSENASSIVSFYTARNNSTGSVSEREVTLEHLEADFLTSRSNDDVSSHLYDLSSRVDERSDHDNSTTMHSYHTCRRFNSQGLLSIMKVNNDIGNEEKKFNIPFDVVLMQEEAQKRHIGKSQLFRWRCYVGLFIGFVLFVFVPAVVATMLLVRRQNTGSETVVEQGTIYNVTLVPVPAQSNAPSAAILSPSPTRAPLTSSPNFPSLLGDMYPSQLPSIEPTTARHRDNIFLRLPKKKQQKIIDVVDLFN